MQTPKFRILVVDDFDLWRRLLCTTLSKEPDLEVVGEASDGFEATQKVEELNPDLVLLEIDLREVNGLEVARRIRETVPGAKIVFLSHLSDPDIIEAAMGEGAHGYIIKMNAGTGLLAAIKAILRGERYVSEVK